MLFYLRSLGWVMQILVSGHPGSVGLGTQSDTDWPLLQVLHIHCPSTFCKQVGRVLWLGWYPGFSFYSLQNMSPHQRDQNVKVKALCRHLELNIFNELRGCVLCNGVLCQLLGSTLCQPELFRDLYRTPPKPKTQPNATLSHH